MGKIVPSSRATGLPLDRDASLRRGPCQSRSGFGGRPRGWRLYSKHSSFAVASVQILSPSGRSRRMDSRTRATSVSNIGELTASTQPSPRGARPASRRIKADASADVP